MSNYIVAEWLDDVLLGMTLHVSNSFRIDHIKWIVRMSEDDLSIESCKHGIDDNRYKVWNMSVKSHWKILRKIQSKKILVMQAVSMDLTSLGALRTERTSQN